MVQPHGLPSDRIVATSLHLRNRLEPIAGSSYIRSQKNAGHAHSAPTLSAYWPLQIVQSGGSAPTTLPVTPATGTIGTVRFPQTIDKVLPITVS
jgi:hypothetical protein